MEQYSFGYWLRRNRQARGLTRKELAHRVGCSIATIRKLEAEERRPSGQLIDRLVEIFHIPPEERIAFLRFARGEWRFAPLTQEDHPWQVSEKFQRSNLPARTTSLIGRERDIALLHEYVSKDEFRLVTLMGPPGIGKTRLGLEVARRSFSDFRDGVFFVPLAPLEKASLVAPAIFQALGYVESKSRFTVEQLVQSIGDKQLLILLDNLEHLIEDTAPLVLRLLSACPGLKILATSRESLRVHGEWLYSVPVLDFPKETVSIGVEEVSHFPALTLFAERARAVSVDFSLNRENTQVVTAICARLEGVPLAIELIASRIRFMSPQMLLKQLNEGFVLSADGIRAVATRQKTLHDAIQWSYKLLSREEQELIRRLSVFSGGFTMDAAKAIIADVSTKKSRSDLVGSLLDKSLLQRSPDEYDEPRVNMLMMIREFALGELRKTGKESLIRDKHLTYFLHLAEQADQEIHGPDQLMWLERIERDHNNFQAALEWCITNLKVELALRLLGALAWIWWIRGHYSEMRSWFDKVRALPGVSDHAEKYAKLLNRVGGQSWNIGSDRDAQSLLEEAQAIWLSLGEEGELGLADCLTWMGLAAMDGERDVARAGSFVERSIALYQKHADLWGCGMSMLNAGYVGLGRNRSISPLFWFEQSLERFEQLGDIWGKSNVYQCIGRIYLDQGKYEKARIYFEKQMSIDQRLWNISAIISGLCDLGHLSFYQGNIGRAEEYYQKSLATCRRMACSPIKMFYSP